VKNCPRITPRRIGIATFGATSITQAVIEVVWSDILGFWRQFVRNPEINFAANANIVGSKSPLMSVYDILGVGYDALL
jgi:hypothetical protein